MKSWKLFSPKGLREVDGSAATVEAGNRRPPHGQPRLLRAAADVRRADEIRQSEQRRAGWWFNREHVGGGAGQTSLDQRRRERRFVDDRRRAPC